MEQSLSPPMIAAASLPDCPAVGAARIPCPLCEYDLRGLVEPRCPECGYRFTWDELNDPSRRFHPWLFEHHPRRNAWSFTRTLAHGLLPVRFWSTLYPTQPSRAGRIVAYWVLCALPLLGGIAALAGLYVAEIYGGVWGPAPVRRYGLWRLATWAAANDARNGGMIIFSVLALAWPWLTMAALLVFQASLRRARLRTTHVLRCVLYSADVVVWCAAAVAVIALFAWVGRTGTARSPLGDDWVLAPLAVGLWLSYRLFVAYRLYLRFDHALATVLASQVIVALACWKLWFMAQGL